MYNQNQFGQNMGMGLPNLPTPQELWKDEKMKYRPWMILLVFGLMAILSLLIASIITNVVNRQGMIDAILNHPDTDSATTIAEVESFVLRTYILYPAFYIAVVSIGTGLYVQSLIMSYKKKTFAYISTWGTYIVGIGAFFAMIELFWSNSITFETVQGKLSFSTNILYIAIYLAISRKVVMIRRTFILSERVALLKNNPMFNQGTVQPEGFKNPFGPTAARTNTATPGMKDPTMNGATETAQAPINPELEKLQKMSVGDLKKVAGKLSISGSDEMEKPELIEAIMKVTSGK